MAALTLPGSPGEQRLPSTLWVTPAYTLPVAERFLRSGGMRTPGCARDAGAAVGTGVLGAVALTGLPEQQHSSVPTCSAPAEVAGIKCCPAPAGNTHGHSGKACGDVRTAGISPRRWHHATSITRGRSTKPGKGDQALA